LALLPYFFSKLGFTHRFVFLPGDLFADDWSAVGSRALGELTFFRKFFAAFFLLFSDTTLPFDALSSLGPGQKLLLTSGGE